MNGSTTMAGIVNKDATLIRADDPVVMESEMLSILKEVTWSFNYVPK